jgi:hypothetical protein
MPLADDQVRELVRRFAALDMTAWDDAAFDRALATLGWRPTQASAEERKQSRRYPRLWNYEDFRPGCKGESHEQYDTGLGTGLGEVARHGSDIGSEISVSVGEGEELFRRLRAALEETLGPPSIMRGPGPLLRWRHPVRLLELEHAGGRTSLRVSPTDAIDRDEHLTSTWAESEAALEQIGYWQVLGRGWDWAPGGEDRTLHLQARIPGDPGPGWSETMTELGWQPPDDPDLEGLLVRDFPAFDWQQAGAAAHMLVGALRSYCVPFEDLWHEVISPDVDLLGIGLPTEHGDRN